jgi:toxin ParE1/3/4
LKRRIKFSAAAIRQLRNIRRYIAQRSHPDTAHAYVAGITAQCRKFGDMPGIGTPRDDLIPGLRTFVFRRRVVIAYASSENEIEIALILYGGQDLERFFDI